MSEFDNCLRCYERQALCETCTKLAIADACPHRWKSVANEMPKTMGYYLVKKTGGILNVGIRYCMDYRGDKRLRFWFNGGECKNVTHWMEIPK